MFLYGSPGGSGALRRQWRRDVCDGGPPTLLAVFTASGPVKSSQRCEPDEEEMFVLIS